MYTRVDMKQRKHREKKLAKPKVGFLKASANN